MSLAAKLWYFTYFASISFAVPFLNVFYRRHIGLDESQIGVIALASPLVRLPAGNIWAGLSDKHALHETLLIVTLCISATARTLLPFIPFPNDQLLPILIYVLFTECFTAPITIIADSTVSAACKSGVCLAGYGRQRMWGAIGWGISSPIAGVILEWHGASLAFSIHLAITVVVVVATKYLPFHALHDPPPENCSTEPGSYTSKVSASYWDNLKTILKDKDMTLFLARSVVLGYGVGHIENYLFLYLEELSASEALMGLTLTVTCIAETVIFWYTDIIVGVFGVKVCFHITFAAFIIRMGYYVILPHIQSPWWVLPAELLHGITFGLAWGAGTRYCSSHSPTGLEATTQSLFQGLYFGIGYGAGGWVGGLVYQYFGAAAVYCEASIVMMIGWSVCSILPHLAAHGAAACKICCTSRVTGIDRGEGGDAPIYREKPWLRAVGD